MARLQYALLAEFARVDSSGLITVVGAGFDRITAPILPANQAIAVAARVLVPEGETQADVSVLLTQPEGLQFRVEQPLVVAPDAKPHRGFNGVALAMNLMMPLNAEGLYQLQISVDGSEPQELSFYVEVARSSAQDSG